MPDDRVVPNLPDQVRIWDNQTLSDRQERVLSMAARLSEQEGELVVPESARGVVSAWLLRETYLAAAEAAQLRNQGVRMDVADGVAEDNPGFLMAATFVDCLGG